MANEEELFNRSQKFAQEVRKANKDILGSTLEINDAKELQLDLTKEAVKAVKQGKFEQADELKIQRSQVKILQDKVKLLSKTRKNFKEINAEAQNIAGSLQGIVEKLPGGKRLSKLFGVDKLGKNFEKALNETAKVYMNTAGSVADKTNAAMSAFGPNLMAAINPLTIIAVLAAAAVTAFLDFEKKAKGVADATGLTLSQSKELVKESKLAARARGVELATSTDILAVQKATVKEFGIANMLSGKQAANIADIGRSFGIGASNAAAVTNEFMRMGMGGQDASDALLQVSAEALKAGVSVGTVTADIAANAKDVAKFFGGNVKELRKAAVQAAKLGVSLKTMASVSEGLLKFEDSITSQFEFQAMTGKMINLDKARQLALDGKIAEATQEVLSNVGSLAEFDAMRPLAQRKLAEATGMNVDELTKSLAVQEKLANATDDQRAAAMGLNLSAAEIASKSPEQLQKLLAQQEASGQIAKDFAVLKDDLASALIPLGQVLLTVFSGISSVVSYIVDGFKMLAPILKVIGILLSPILAIMGAMAIVSAITTAMATFAAFPIIGFALAASAVAGIVGYVGSLMNVGDLGIDPNGGPVVMSPQEGGIFQGTRNDGVSMSPSHGTSGGDSTSTASSTPGVGNAAIASAIAKTNALLQQILDTGTTIEMDGQVVGATLRTSDSFRRR